MSNANSNTQRLDNVCESYPEVRVHLARLRAIHMQRKRGVNDPVLPKLKVKARPEPPQDDVVSVKLRLAPEVLNAFRACGADWKGRINDVLLALVGSEQGEGAQQASAS